MSRKMKKKELAAELEKVSSQLESCVSELRTERQQKKMLEKKARHLEHIFKESLDVQVLINPTNKQIEDISQSVKPFLGYSPKELIGKDFSELFPEEEKSDRDKVLAKTRNFDTVFANQTFRKADGSIAVMDLTATLISRNGKKAILVTLRKSGERWQAEEQQHIRVKKLEKYLRTAKKLSGFLPICVHCKKIRDEEGYWQEVEEYIRQRTDVAFSHSICPDCMEKYYSGHTPKEDDAE